MTLLPFRKKYKKEDIFVKTYSPMRGFERYMYAILVSLGVYSSIRYALWWFRLQHIPLNWPNSPLHIFDLLIFLSLSFVVFFGLLLKIGTWFTVWFIKRPMPKYISNGQLKVAFVTCYVPGKEPIEMLKDTLIAMRDATYKHDTWVLDEGNDPEVKKLCHELGVFHFSRKGKPQYNQTDGAFRTKTKAGNLNSWRNEFEHNYDIIAQLDMDHKPHKEYLARQIGYFSDPEVGYVIIPQIYKNTDNWIARGASEQTHFYYGPLQQGFYGAHMPFLIGTTHIYRVEAMRQFGGYAPTIAEDYLTSMHFSSHGWKGVYLPEVLAEGYGPTNWTNFYNQQMRWSYGLYEILFQHTHRHFPKLTFLQKINLFFSQMFYFSGIATVTGFILTSLYLIFGINSSSMSFYEWCIYALPAYFSGILIYMFLHRYFINPKKEPIFALLGSFLSMAASIVYAVAFIDFITHKKLTYKITAKDESSHNVKNLVSLTTHIYILLLGIISLEISFIINHSSLIMRLWETVSIFLMTMLVLGSSKDSVKNLLKKSKTHKMNTTQPKQRKKKNAWSTFLLPFSLGLLLAVITFYYFHHLDQFLTAIIVFVSFAMTLQGIFFLFLMLYAWEDPEEIEKHKEPKKYLPPTYSFTALIPARNEEKVIADTIRTIAAIDYPDEKKEIIIICKNDDYLTIAKAQNTIYDLNRRNIRLIRFEDSPVNKPHALNIGMQFATKDIIVIFDAEDEPHPQIYNNINTIFLTENPDVIQSGVQLMNINSPWFAVFNVLEYFFWFKSALHFFAKLGCLPLAGNSTFFKKSILKKVHGWDENCLTEDADIGLRLSKIGAKFRLVYDEKYVTREETPPCVSSFIKQRSRWNQGFLQVFAKGDWTSVQGTVQKLFAFYVLTLPEFQAFSLIYTPLVFLMIWKFKLQVALALFSFTPMYILVLQLLIYNIGLYEFCKNYKIPYSFWSAIKLFFLFYPYQLLLGVSALRAVLRFIIGKKNWEKTLHLNIHREFALEKAVV